MILFVLLIRFKSNVEFYSSTSTRLASSRDPMQAVSVIVSCAMERGSK